MSTANDSSTSITIFHERLVHHVCTHDVCLWYNVNEIVYKRAIFGKKIYKYLLMQDNEITIIRTTFVLCSFM